MGITEHKIASVEQLTDFDEEYVYDIIMEDSSMPYFFANSILVHNSCYFKTFGKTVDEGVAIADEVQRIVNESFPPFARKAFNMHGGRETLFNANREIVGDRGLFLLAKKKYTIHVVDNEGQRVDKLKSMGSEIKKADTPKIIRDFLKDLMKLILVEGVPYEKVSDFVNEKRKKLITGVDDLFLLGTAKQVNNLDNKYAQWQQEEKGKNAKLNLPGHVRAAINYNESVQHFKSFDRLLTAGDKAAIFYVKPNDFNFTSLAFPAEMDDFPSWFKENFKVDKEKTEQKMIDSKLKRIFEAIGWPVPTVQRARISKVLKF